MCWTHLHHINDQSAPSCGVNRKQENRQQEEQEQRCHTQDKVVPDAWGDRFNELIPTSASFIRVCFRVCECAPYLHRRCAAAAWERWGWDETWTDPQRHRDKPRTQTGQNHLPEPAPCERKRKTLFINTATGVRGQGFFTLTLVVLTEPISTSCTAALVSKVICQSLTSVLPPRGQVHV